MNPTHDEIRRARVHLAAANRLAVYDDLEEGIDNHFTMRVPGQDDRYLVLPFGLHWSEARASESCAAILERLRTMAAKNATAQMTAIAIRISFAGSTALMSVKPAPVKVGSLRPLHSSAYRSSQYAIALSATKIPASTAS